MPHGQAHSANIQDRDGGGLVIATLFGFYPFLTKLFADGGYQGPLPPAHCQADASHIDRHRKRSGQREIRLMGAFSNIPGTCIAV